MCLVSYNPTPSGFILGSNRDESPSRSATQLVTESIGDHTVHYPRDMMGGSWIMFSDKGLVVCLLNGAIVKHRHQPPYRMSRGVIIKQLFEQPTAADFIEQVDLFNIEPFTTVISDDHKLYEFRWDGMIKHINVLDKKETHIWSSCTLYTPAMQVDREAHFKSLLSKISNIDPSSIRNIHLTGDIQDPANNFVMNRENRVKTISHSLLARTGDAITFDFMNLENGLGENINLHAIH